MIEMLRPDLSGCAVEISGIGIGSTGVVYPGSARLVMLIYCRNAGK